VSCRKMLLRLLLAALALLRPTTATVASVAPPRIAVYGGSGYIGSRVCQALSNAGCAVVSISRTGKPPAWAALEPWSAKVEWKRADVLSADDTCLGSIDGAVSCIGNMRPSATWDGFFGLFWDYERLVRENGLVHARAAEDARRAGATRMVVLSVSSTKKWAYGGALEGYIAGKEAGEAAARRVFGDDNIAVVGPSLVLGGGRAAWLLGPYAAVADSPAIRGQTKFFKAFKQGVSTGYGPQDAVNEVALTPPASVESTARAVCACLLDTVSSEQLVPLREQQREEDDIRGLLKDQEVAGAYSFMYVDGTDQIRSIAEASGTPALLAAAAGRERGTATPRAAPAEVAAPAEATAFLGRDWQRLPLDRKPVNAAMVQNDALRDALASDRSLFRSFSRVELDGFGLTDLAAESYVMVGELGRADSYFYKPCDTTQSPSAHGAPNEGLLFGFKPLLYPWAPAAALFGAFATAVSQGTQL